MISVERNSTGKSEFRRSAHALSDKIIIGVKHAAAVLSGTFFEANISLKVF